MKNKNKGFEMLRKKKVMLVVMVLLLAVTGYINYRYKPSATEETAKVLGEAQFVSSNEEVKVTPQDVKIMAREEARDKSISMLKDIINGENYTAEAKADAQKRLVEITEYIRIEGDIELQLKNKGFENVVVTYNENGIVIDILTEKISNNEVAKITEIAVSQTGLTAEKIKITAND